MKNKKFKRLIKLNTILTAVIIASDVFLLHPHNTANSISVGQVTVSHQMKHKPMNQLRSIQADEEQEFSAT
ncbi:hypothetical protein [Companilactobacillus kimchiensis]|uniref:Uncharacterized protein n=1 Tax=Companilactobacillus kimchiensis TaxID=993692 RepID=A0A0R2LLT6_9LACO|nr:hypothetical protein [Companilactobacillus kimchiensis]KRO00859.1 hypothetical protein IV57_GL000180 [Companilactobacillus kimchiensis]